MIIMVTLVYLIFSDSIFATVSQLLFLLNCQIYLYTYSSKYLNKYNFIQIVPNAFWDGAVRLHHHGVYTPIPNLALRGNLDSLWSYPSRHGHGIFLVVGFFVPNNSTLLPILRSLSGWLVLPCLFWNFWQSRFYVSLSELRHWLVEIINRGKCFIFAIFKFLNGLA